MKKWFFAFGTLVLFLCIFVFHANAWDYPIIADVLWIEFNHSSYNNSLNIRKNYSTDVLKPEWYPSVGNRNEPIAYKAGDSGRRVKAAFVITEGGDDIYNLRIDAAATANFGTLGNVWVSISNGQGNAYFTTTSWSVPSTVDIRDFKLYWEINGVNDEGFDMYQPILFDITGWHTYYTVLNTPQSPMSEPWTEVLDYACDWASGESSISIALADLADELYNCGVTYDGGTHYTSGSYTHLNLTGLLADLSNPDNVEMDCRDFSNFLQVLLNSLGGNSGYNRIDRTTSPYYFIYNYLYPAGWENKANPGAWNYHQVAWYNSKVADAAAKIDNDADPTSSPHSWKLAVGDMTLSDYIDKLTETPDVSSVATGTCTVY